MQPLKVAFTKSWIYTSRRKKNKPVGFEIVELNIFQALVSVMILFKRVEVFWHCVVDLT